MAFCHNCGGALVAGDRFCGSCGHSLSDTAAPVSQPQPIPPPPVSQPVSNYNPPAYTPAPSSEQIYGAIPVIHKKSMFSQESFHIIVTQRRLVLALFTNEMAKEEAKKQGKEGFWSGMVGAMTLGYTYYKRYLELDPEMALRENTQNFQIDRGQIKRVSLREGRRWRDNQRKMYVVDNSKLDIETGGPKYSFEIVSHFHDMAQDVLGRSRLI